MKTARVTNSELFEKVLNLDFDFHKGGLNGDVTITTAEGERVYTGEHGTHDYDEEFGFIIEDVKYYIIDTTSNHPSIAYVCEDGNIIHTEENAMFFTHEKEAQQWINDKGIGDWASIMMEI